MAGEMQRMEVEVAMTHPAPLVWKTFIHELETSVPAMLPGHFQKIEHVEGPAFAPGGLFVATYGPDVSHYTYVKGRWDEIDHENFTFKVSLVDGGALGKHFSHLVYYFKILPNNDTNTCVMHFTVEYQDIGEHTFHDFIKEEIEKVCTTLESNISSL